MPASQKVQLHDTNCLQLMFMADSLYFPAGTQYKYSNTGYAILSLIVEQVSGKPFAQFLKENIQLYKQDSVIGRYLVLEKSTTQIMGMFSYLLLSDELNYHIGFALLPIFWGKGYALELVKFGVPYFFSHQPSNELYAITNKENAASQKVLLNSGFEATKNFLLNEQALDLYVIRK
jgi:RimJ/RimL family protein N-acetyltransferase